MSEHNPAVNLPQTMFINGEKTHGTSGKTFPVFNPATSEELAQIPDASESDIDHAVRTSKAAFESDAWRRMPPAARERRNSRLCSDNDLCRSVHCAHSA